MSISSEISRISQNVSDSLAAVAAKGVTVPAGSNSDDLADLIGQISGGGGTTWETEYSGQVGIQDWGDDLYYIQIPNYYPAHNDFIYGETYRITWKGNQYVCVVQEQLDYYGYGDTYCIGNATLAGGTTGNNEPFFAQSWGDDLMFATTDSSGTFTLIIEKQIGGGGGGSTLVPKTITANGTYDPADDNADGYSEVTVNVQGGGDVDFPTFSITTDSNFTTVLSVTCDKTYSECLTLATNEQYNAVFEIDEDGYQYISGAVCADTAMGKVVYSAGTADVAWLVIDFFENGTISGTTNPIAWRHSSDLTESGGTVTVPAGYYEFPATKSVASGTAGTPTATKGTVSNHSISVTPSVTNTTGYITGSTKTGTAVTVSASELVSGSETKTANGTYDVTNLASLVVNVSGGSGIGTLLNTTSLGSISSSSTQAASLNISLEVTGINNYDLLIVESSVNSTTNNRHTATVGVIYLTAGSDIGTKNGSTIATAKWNSKLSNTGTATTSVSTTAYGIYPNSCSISNGTASIPMYRRYNSTSTGTINGTYTARVYGVNLYNLIGG